MKKVMSFAWVKMWGVPSFFAVEVLAAFFFPATAAALDRQSMECLGCHDAAIATDVSQQVCIEPADCDHPFGIDYSTVSKSNRGLKPVGDLPQSVKLADGRTIGCGTCHVPFNMDDHSILSSMRNLYPVIPDPMLVMDNRQSELCYGCHLK